MVIRELAPSLAEIKTAWFGDVHVADDPRTLRVLQVTGLDRVFALERTLSAAIDAAIGVGKARSA